MLPDTTLKYNFNSYNYQCLNFCLKHVAYDVTVNSFTNYTHAMNSKKMIPIVKESDGKDGEGRALIKVMDRPTFILKTREGDNRAVSPSQRNGNK